MKNTKKRWEILNKNIVTDIGMTVDILLKNRGLNTVKQKKEFIDPLTPMKIKLKELGISEIQTGKAIERIKKAKLEGEHVIVYGDYDADGITATAIMWEVLHEIGINVLPYIPDRFLEGYGLNLESVKNLKKKDPSLGLIITVDHGITAGKKVDEIKKIGIDMIISDHHQAGKNKPKPVALIHTTKIGGSGIAWFLAREIAEELQIPNSNFQIQERLQLAAIGTVADQLPLIGANRSIVKFGLSELNKTLRPGLIELFRESGLIKGSTLVKAVGTYEVGFVIAPRINATGRLTHGLTSLRLLCTKDSKRAVQIAKSIGSINIERQNIVEQVVEHAKLSYKEIEKKSVIVLSHEDYHEGVIGLAASRLVEEFYRPAIVISKNGEIAKASARSISGFNIIEAIRSLDHLYLEGGGHTMAAGFSIDPKNINKFSDAINLYAEKLLTPQILRRALKIDLEVPFLLLTGALYNKLKVFEPSGLGNPTPTFISRKVEVVDARPVGQEEKHLKLKLKQDGQIFDSIFFGGGKMYSDLNPTAIIDVVYRLEENSWNGHTNLQLLIRDLRVH
jgi:single-stranded-DNA-specific exonuclease